MRSTTRQGSTSSRLRSWVALNSQSKITRSMPVFSQISRSSSSRPSPRQVALSGDSRRWMRRPSTCAPAVAASSASSSSDLSASYSPVSTAASTARSGCRPAVSFSFMRPPPADYCVQYTTTDTKGKADLPDTFQRQQLSCPEKISLRMAAALPSSGAFSPKADSRSGIF